MPTFSRSLEKALHRALALANERQHELATLEHLLLALIDDKDNDIRRAAILGLTATKKDGSAAVPKLMDTLNNVNEDETIRSLAKVALKSVDPRKGLMGADKERE